MSDVTMDQFNGLGARVSETELSVTRCQAKRGVEIHNLKAGQKKTETGISELFDKVNKIEKIVAVQWAKITVGVVVGFAIVQLVFKYLPVIGK